MQSRILITLLIFSVIFGYAAFEAYTIDQKFPMQNAQIKPESFLKELPNVMVDEFESDEGLNFSNLKGKNVIVHFWATWCAPCEREFPELLKLFSKYNGQKDNILILVAVKDEYKKISKFLEKFSNQLKGSIVLVDRSDISQKYFGTYKLPETFLFDKNAQFVRKFSGAQDWNDPKIVQFLDAVMIPTI